MTEYDNYQNMQVGFFCLLTVFIVIFFPSANTGYWSQWGKMFWHSTVRVLQYIRLDTPMYLFDLKIRVWNVTKQNKKYNNIVIISQNSIMENFVFHLISSSDLQLRCGRCNVLVTIQLLGKSVVYLFVYV